MSGVATMRAMIELGLSDEQKLILLAAIEADAGPSRSTSAERQRRYRERKKAGPSVTSNVTPLRNDRDVTRPPIEELHTPPSSEPVGSSEDPTTPKSNGKSPPAVTPEQVIEAWNTMADGAGVPKAKLTPERRRKLATFVRRHTTDDITEAIWAVPRSPFLCGENDRGWKAGIDFILQPSSFTKLIEGTYDRSTH